MLLLWWCEGDDEGGGESDGNEEFVLTISLSILTISNSWKMQFLTRKIFNCHKCKTLLENVIFSLESGKNVPLFTVNYGIYSDVSFSSCLQYSTCPTLLLTSSIFKARLSSFVSKMAGMQQRR